MGLSFDAVRTWYNIGFNSSRSLEATVDSPISSSSSLPMAASAVARSILRAASSRGAAAGSTGRFASQAKSVPPMFRASAKRSSLLSPLRLVRLFYQWSGTSKRVHFDRILEIHFWKETTFPCCRNVCEFFKWENSYRLLATLLFFVWLVEILWRWASVLSQCYHTTPPQLLL